MLFPGGEKTVVDPLRRLANTVGRDSKLSTRGTLIDGELRSAQGPGSAPPVWFVFTGDDLRTHDPGKIPVPQAALQSPDYNLCGRSGMPG